MKNKNLFSKFGFMLLAIGCFGFSYTSAASFNLNLGELETWASQITQRMIPIHFADNGNDFGGFIYFSNDVIEGDGGGSQEVTEPSEIPDLYQVSLGGDNYECKRLLEGFYYNAERGERLRPLDAGTFNKWKIDENGNMNGLVITGGIYTLCGTAGYGQELDDCYNQGGETPDEPGGETPDEPEPRDVCVKRVDDEFFSASNLYFGQVEHQYEDQNFGLVIGVDYSKNDGHWYGIEGNSGLTGTFKRFYNTYPMGFLYDYNGGLGFAGCEIIASPKSGVLGTLLTIFKENKLENYFIKDNGKVKVKTDSDLNGKVDCTNIGSAADTLINMIVEGLIGMNRESDLGIIGNESDEKMQYFGSEDINNATLLTYAKQKSEILCRGKWKGIPENVSDLDNSSNVVCLESKNLINKVDASISKRAKEHGKTLIVKNADVEIESSVVSNETGYYDMFINNGNLKVIESGDAEKFAFTTQGFIDMNINTYGDYESALTSVLGSAEYYTGNLAAWASLIKGNFIVDGNIISANEDKKLKNKYFIYGKITTKDTFESLLKTFTWRCDGGGKVNGTSEICPHTYADMGYVNPYHNASLVVIDQNYDSPLYW